MKSKFMGELLSGAEFKTSIVAVVLLFTTLFYLAAMATVFIFAFLYNKQIKVPEYIFSSFQFVIGSAILGVVGNGGVSVFKNKLEANISNEKEGV